MIGTRTPITVLISESDGSFTFTHEWFNPEEVCGEDVIVSIFKRGDSVALKAMKGYDKKHIAFGILKYAENYNNIDKFKTLWTLHNTIDPDEVDQIIERLVYRNILTEF